MLNDDSESRAEGDAGPHVHFARSKTIKAQNAEETPLDGTFMRAPPRAAQLNEQIQNRKLEESADPESQGRASTLAQMALLKQSTATSNAAAKSNTYFRSVFGTPTAEKYSDHLR